MIARYRLSLLPLLLLIQTTLADVIQAQVGPEQPPRLAVDTTIEKPSTASPAVTLPEAVSTAPISTESFSTIQCAPSEEPALILPVPVVFGPGQWGNVALLMERRNSFVSGSIKQRAAETDG